MKPTSATLLFTLISVISFAQTEFSTYKDSVSGWSTQYLSSTHLMTPDEIATVEGRGQDAIESSIDQELDILRHRNLIWLRKDLFNSMTSNVQPFDAAVDGDYEEVQTGILEIIKQTYSDQGIQFDIKTEKTKIDGLEFNAAYITLYAPDRSKVLLNQIIYDRLIEGKLILTININYNDLGKEEMLSIIKASKFSKRK